MEKTGLNQNFLSFEKELNAIRVRSVSTARAKEILNGICGKTTKFDCRSIKRFIANKKDDARAAESMNLSLNDSFMLTTITKPEKSGAFFVRNAILGLDISRIQ